MKKRGQAALEFLTTYGWAFLVILIMIGALAYFGILNPNKFLPSRCTFSPEIDCVEAIIQTDDGTGGTVNFRFRNQVGSTATFTVAMSLNEDAPVICDVPGNTSETLTDVPPGRVREVECDFTAGTFPVGDKIKFEVDATYRKSGGNYDIPVKGEIYGTVTG